MKLPDLSHLSVRRLVAGCLVVALGGFVAVDCKQATAALHDQLRKAATLLRNRENKEALQVAATAPADGARSLLQGKAALRLNRYDEAIRYLSDAERSYPLLADVAAALKADALFAAGQYREAAGAASHAARITPNQIRRRRMEKLAADALFEVGDSKGALGLYRPFILQNSLGNESVDALLKAALCQESLGDISSAVAGYRQVYLQYPASNQSAKAFDKLKALEKAGHRDAAAFVPEDQYKRALLLLGSGQANAAAWALANINRQLVSDELLARIELKSGQAAIKQRHYSLAEPFLKRAAATRFPQVHSEAALSLARVEERLGNSDRALALLLSLASDRGSLADDALLEAALIHKHSGRFAEAAQLLQRLVKDFPSSELAVRGTWELAWGLYLSGNLPAAEEQMRKLIKDLTYRERALYWCGRIFERQNRSADAQRNYQQLLQDYPFGFYAAWYRNRTGQSSGWPALGQVVQEPRLSESSQRIQALVALGMLEEARTELSAFKAVGQDREAVAALARMQQMAGDLHGSIVTFHQNRPPVIDRSNMGFWAIGYPRPYGELFGRYSTLNGLSESLVVSLAKAESSFRPDVKSPAGAIGIMQMMPATARMTAGVKGKKGFNPQSLVDPELNIKLGTKHLRELLNQYYQDPVYTLAAYNAGSTAVNRWRKAFGDLPRDEFVENIPYQETRDYVKKIVGYMAVYRSLYRIP